MALLMWDFLYLLSVSWALTMLLTPLMILCAQHFNIIDTPDGKLKIHKTPTPYLGGVGVFFGTFLSLALFGYTFVPSFILFLTILTTLGFIDDIWPLSSKLKFLVQAVVSVAAVASGYSFGDAWWLQGVSFFWIISVMNCYNLVDVMDGLATTLAICAASTLFICAYMAGSINSLPIFVAFLGALLSFLLFNRPPAKIYLGDTGSLFIGSFLALSPFLIDWSANKAAISVLMTVVIAGYSVAIPGIEVLTLICVRFYKKIPIYQGSPDHYSCYLQQSSWSKAIILIYSACASMAFSGGLFLYFFSVLTEAGVLAWGACCLLVWYANLITILFIARNAKRNKQ